MSIRCHQCGKVITGPAKECPRCGDTLKDEMKERVRKDIHLRRKDIELGLVAVIIFLVVCLAAVYSQRFYTWEEHRTSTVHSKDTNTYMMCMSYGKYGCTMWVPETDYYLYLEDGNKESVSESTYNRVNIGDSYNYSITHTDWKPGMKDAPIPPWAFLLPLGAGLAIIMASYCRIVSRREKEMKEWKETGDTEVEGAKEVDPEPDVDDEEMTRTIKSLKKEYRATKRKRKSKKSKLSPEELIDNKEA